MLPYALAIFTGAFLLFQVQPLIGKYILPWFGGGPGVWTTCLLFFQTLLLGGYAYAHFTSTKLKPKQQALLHLILLALALLLLPIAPSEAWKARIGGNPNWDILLLLTATIGLPYFVLSSTGPLMQQWFSVTNSGVSPYRLYALSNVGSLLALLSYPIFFEVKFPRHSQSTMWSAGLGLFVIFCGWCALKVWRHCRAGSPDPGVRLASEVVAGAAGAAGSGDPALQAPSAVDKLLWLSLPAIASVLLLATTNKLCQEVAVIPFLWVLPLSLYLLTFIISFDHARWYNRSVFTVLLVLSMAAVFSLLPVGNDAPMLLQIIGYNAALFIACMVCHGELYQLKPTPRHLTAYFLYISAGGAIGGFLVAIVAPAVFNDYRELQLGLWVLSYGLGVLCLRHQSRAMALSAGTGAMLAVFFVPWLRSMFDDGPNLFAGLRHAFEKGGVGGVFSRLGTNAAEVGVRYWTELQKFFEAHGWVVIVALAVFVVCVWDWRRYRPLREFRPRMAAFMMALCVGLGALVVVQWPHKGTTKVLTASRNFYGTLKVFDYYPNDAEDHYKLLLHGATTHGFQFQKPEKSIMATSYYGENSGIGLALDHLQVNPRRIGLVGLGTGSLAVYARKGDALRIYEINPAVEQLARAEFTYLENCPAQVSVVMGDARLMMEQELARGEKQQFDVLALDAFSSDAIPVHLLTKEAFDLYWQHVKPDGVIAVHVSNRYLNLRPIVEKLAGHFGATAATIYDDHDSNWWIYATTWILVSKNKAFLDQAAIAERTEAPEPPKKPAPLWTDDYASLYSILK